jgi:hypothetical protein
MIKLLKFIGKFLYKLSSKIRSLSVKIQCLADKTEEAAYYKKIKKEKGYTKKEWQERQGKLANNDVCVLTPDVFQEAYKNLGASTSDLISFRLGFIKGKFEKWEKDINDTSIKDISSSFGVSGYAYNFDNCKKPSCVLVESNGRK